MRTREEALAAVEANFADNIATRQAQLASAEDGLRARIEIIDTRPAVVNCRQAVAYAQAALEEELASQRSGAAYQRAVQDVNDAQAQIAALYSRRADRIRAVNAYYDALAQQAAIAPIVGAPPEEAA